MIAPIAQRIPSGAIEREARAAGAQDYFIKPFSVEQLTTFIQRGAMAS